MEKTNLKENILISLQRIVPQITDIAVTMEKTHNGTDWYRIRLYGF